MIIRHYGNENNLARAFCGKYKVRLCKIREIYKNMKLLLTSAGWEENPEIGKEFLRLVGKPIAKVKIFAAITPDKFYKRNKYIKRTMKIGIKKQNVIFFS